MAMTLGIVVPCYNEQDVLPETCNRLLALRARLLESGKIRPQSRICFVDDGSRDRTWNIVESFCESGLPVIGVKLSRNQGHQNALLAGLFTTPGDALVSIDADLQDDIEVIERMADAFSEGYEVVYGVRSDRQADALFKRVTAGAFYRLLGALGVETVRHHADFRLLSRRAIEALKEYREVNLYLRGIVPLLGFPSLSVEYTRAPRFAGESKYPFRKMLSLAVNAITAFSVAPLRVVFVAGFVIFLLTTLVSFWVLWVRLFTDRAVPGWASTLLPIYFLGGVQILCLGVIGEYLGKVYAETKSRPRFIIDRVKYGEPWPNGRAPAETADGKVRGRPEC